MFQKTIFFLAAFLFAATVSTAQVQFGVKGGINLAGHIVSEGDVNVDHENVIGYHVGPMLEFGLTENVGINLAALYSVLGSKTSLDLLGTSVNSTSTLNYIQVPLHLVYRGKGFYAGAGPYLGYAIGGKFKIGTTTENFTFGKGDMDRKASDFGISAEAGLNISNNFRAGVGYGLGLSDSDNSNDGSIKNKNLYLTVGYMF